MTFAAILTSQALTSGFSKHPVKTTLTANIAGVKLYAQFTPGQGNLNISNRAPVRVHAAVSPFSIVAADAPIQLKNQAIFFDIIGEQEAALTHEEGEFMMGAGYLYTWLDVPAFATAPTLSLQVGEV